MKYIKSVSKSIFNNEGLTVKLINAKVVLLEQARPDCVRFDDAIETESVLKEHLNKIGLNEADVHHVSKIWSKSKRKAVIKEYIEAFVIAIMLAIFVRTFIVQAFKIPSGSMKNTLLVGDHILVNKFIFGITIPFTDKKIFLKSPERGDVIVFKFPKNEDRDFIKRVVGVGGDTIVIRNQRVYVNDELPVEPHARHMFPPAPYTDPNYQPRDNHGPIEVPEGKLFVMGDNRENSQDSRFWGFVDINKVKGKAFIIYWSWNKEATDVISHVRWNRFGKLLK